MAKIVYRHMRIGLVVAGLGIAAGAWAQQYTAQGEFMMPKDFRTWVYLSTGIGMTYGNASAHPNFDNVFVNPAAYQAFLKTGTWPDKTVLVTENRSSEPDPLSKDGKYQGKLLGYEAHVKDAGHGGWSFYVFRPDTASAKAMPRSAGCAACHEKNGATDTTFVQFYPSLIDTAMQHGTFRKTGE